MTEIPDIRSTLERLAETQCQIKELKSEASRQFFNSSLDNGEIVVQVDGTGKLCEISISNNQIHSSHPSQIGPKIVAAISEARRQAMEYTSIRATEILPSFGD